MKLRRKLPACLVALGVVAGLTLVGPSATGAVPLQMEMGCQGADEETINLITLGVPEWRGTVPIPINTFEADVPETLTVGESANVTFTWLLDPGPALRDLAVSVNIVSLTGVGTAYVEAGGTGGSGRADWPGSIPFIGLEPPDYPTVVAPGTVTATAPGTIEYTMLVPQLDLTTQSSATDATQVIALTCQVNPATLNVSTQVVEAGGGGGGPAAPQDSVQATQPTTAPRTSTGVTNSTVTG